MSASSDLVIRSAFRVAYINGSSYPNRPNQFFPAYLHHLGQVARHALEQVYLLTTDDVQDRTGTLTGGLAVAGSITSRRVKVYNLDSDDSLKVI